MRMIKLLIIHNIASAYYKNIVFNSLYKKYKNFKVIHIAETQKDRDWNINLSYLEYPYKILFKDDLERANKILLVKKILKILNKENPDIIYVGGYTGIVYWAALLWGKNKKKRIIIEMNSNKFVAKKRIVPTKILKEIFIKNCDLGLTYGDLSKQYLIELGMQEDQIIIKPNVTNNEWWEKESLKYKMKRDEIIIEKGLKKFNFIYVGRFSKEKNLFYLLDSFKIAKEKTGDRKWGLLMIGDGPLREKLKEFSEKLNIKDVFFVGFKQKDALPEFLAASDVLILPSLSEPWGMVVNEAMASGLTVFLSNRCGASSEMIRDGENGCIFDPIYKNELVKLIEKTINNELDIEQMKTHSREIVDKFTTEYASQMIKEAVNILADKRVK